MDTKLILTDLGKDPAKYVNRVYIDLIRKEKDDNPYLTDTDSLYPVIPTTNNLAQPYLTPSKHMEYCLFWGGASTIGIGSITWVLRKLK